MIGPIRARTCRPPPDASPSQPTPRLWLFRLHCADAGWCAVRPRLPICNSSACSSHSRLFGRASCQQGAGPCQRGNFGTLLPSAASHAAQLPTRTASVGKANHRQVCSQRARHGKRDGLFPSCRTKLAKIVLKGSFIRQWTPNPAGLLFAARDGRPRSRTNVVRNGLKPILRKLGIPSAETGLHAFRHGLATELAEASVQLTVLHTKLRQASVTTTLKIYAHVIPQSQRDAMERVGGVQSLRSNITLLKFGAK